MKYSAIFFYIALFLISCGSENLEISTEPTQELSDINTIDTSTTEKFITSLCEIRKSQNEEKDFVIEGNLVFENGYFKIFNFTETFEGYTFQYAVVLNPLVKTTIENPDKNSFIAIDDLITSQQINASLFQGNLTCVNYDFQNDGSNDFVLTSNISRNTAIIENQKIVLFDGINDLNVTQIISNSDYTAGVDNDFEGVKEYFEFKSKKGKPTKIILRHEENRKPYGLVEGTLDFTKYQLTWEWSENTSAWGVPEWLTGFIGEYDHCQPLVDEFCKTRVLLSDGYEGYAIVENCQNGGPNYFRLEKQKKELSEFYMLMDNEDDVGSYILLTIFEIENFYMLVFARCEKFEANLVGTSEIGYETTNLVISKRDANSDLESHVMDENGQNLLYTISPENYSIVPCNINQ